jgi:hypothetical protein
MWLFGLVPLHEISKRVESMQVIGMPIIVDNPSVFELIGGNDCAVTLIEQFRSMDRLGKDSVRSYAVLYPINSR